MKKLNALERKLQAGKATIKWHAGRVTGRFAAICAYRKRTGATLNEALAACKAEEK